MSEHEAQGGGGEEERRKGGKSSAQSFTRKKDRSAKTSRDKASTVLHVVGSNFVIWDCTKTVGVKTKAQESEYSERKCKAVDDRSLARSLLSCVMRSGSLFWSSSVVEASRGDWLAGPKDQLLCSLLWTAAATSFDCVNAYLLREQKGDGCNCQRRCMQLICAHSRFGSFASGRWVVRSSYPLEANIAEQLTKIYGKLLYKAVAEPLLSIKPESGGELKYGWCTEDCLQTLGFVCGGKAFGLQNASWNGDEGRAAEAAARTYHTVALLPHGLATMNRQTHAAWRALECQRKTIILDAVNVSGDRTKAFAEIRKKLQKHERFFVCPDYISLYEIYTLDRSK